MTEPTIDEMLAWLNWVDQGTVSEPLIPFTEDEIVAAIRAILEQHRYNRDLEKAMPMKFIEEEKDLEQMQLEAIRAFVERVQERCDWNDGHWDLGKALRDELAAMEKENTQ